MRSLIYVLLLGTLLTAALADSRPGEMAPADVAKWLGFFDKLVTTVVNAPACDRMASDVSTLVDQNKDAIAVAKAARSRGEKLPDAAQQHMLDGVKQMLPAMQRCGQDTKVRAAFAKLDLTRR